MSITEHQPTMLVGRCISRCYCSMQLDHRSNRCKNSLHLRPVSRAIRQENSTQELRLSSSADSVTADVNISGLEELTDDEHFSQQGRRPIRMPKSEDPEQLPAHRRVRPQKSPALAQQKLHQTATRYDPSGPRQEGMKAASGSHEMQDVRHHRSAAPTTKPNTGRAAPLHGNTVQSRPGHSHLQPYWSALESETWCGE